MNIQAMMEIRDVGNNDPVNHPGHYNVIDNHGQAHECIEVIQTLGLSFNVGNAFKYVWRAGRKDETKTIEDLKKAIFYLLQEVDYLETKYDT